VPTPTGDFAIGDIYSTAVSSGGTLPTNGPSQTYTYSFTASQTGYLQIYFRNDPAFFNVSSVSLTAGGPNLLTNGNFTGGGTSQGGIIVPAGWSVIGTAGLGAAGTLSGNQWVDGAVGGFDGLAQNVVHSGTSYILTLQMTSSGLGDNTQATTLSPSGGSIEEVLLFGGALPAGFTLTGTVPLVTTLGPGAPTNQTNVAQTIDNNPNPPTPFQNLYNLTQAQLGPSLSQLTGEVATGAPVSGMQMMTQFMSLLLNPFADGAGGQIGPLPFAPEREIFTPEVANAYASVMKKEPSAQPFRRYDVWASAYGGASQINGNASTVGSHDISARSGGVAVGASYRPSPDIIVGFGLSGGGTGWGLSGNLGSGHSDAFQAGVYGAKQYGLAYVSGAFGFTNHWANTTRTVTVGGNDVLNASYDAQSYGGRLEAGYRIPRAAVTLTPYAAIEAQAFRTPAYSETAASGSPQFALSYNANTATETRSELGSWFNNDYMLANANKLSLSAKLAWAHDWVNGLGYTPLFQSLPTASFVVNGATPARDLVLASVGAQVRMPNGWDVMARFDGEFGNGEQTYAGTARVRYIW
jgi:outer membrane autotransporter protein